MHYIVKVQRNRGQLRITIPRGLMKDAMLEDEEIVILKKGVCDRIVIERYKGK